MWSQHVSHLVEEEYVVGRVGNLKRGVDYNTDKQGERVSIMMK